MASHNKKLNGELKKLHMVKLARMREKQMANLRRDWPMRLQVLVLSVRETVAGVTIIQQARVHRDGTDRHGAIS